MRLLRGLGWCLAIGLVLGLLCSDPVKATISNDTSGAVFVQLCDRPAFGGACESGRMRTKLSPQDERVVSVPVANRGDWWQVLDSPGRRVVGCLLLSNDDTPGRPVFNVSEAQECPR